VKKRHLEVCAACAEFPCSKFKSEEEYLQLKESSSYPPQSKIIPNHQFIKKHGLEKFMLRQNEQMRLLETMLEQFDEGRSKSFYCRAAAALEPSDLRKSINTAIHRIQTENIRPGDLKNKAKILRSILHEIIRVHHPGLPYPGAAE
jgi:hypothetical protein